LREETLQKILKRNKPAKIKIVKIDFIKKIKDKSFYTNLSFKSRIPQTQTQTQRKVYELKF
jgi:hypothetical protein